MNLQTRKELLVRLGQYLQSSDDAWRNVKQKAYAENHWFVPEFVELAASNIAQNYLQPQQLNELVDRYGIPEQNAAPKKVGVVMAGNIPMVGFHDLLCVFISGHIAMVKPSSKDEVLMKHLAAKLIEWNPEVAQYIVLSEMIKNCDAYIATGSNNSSRYFEYYFAKYPSIIRKNRTSIAILTGQETGAELEKLADDVYLFFGLGCRNVTKIFVPHNYDFIPLLHAFKKYDHLVNHHKYKNNYDYNLAIHILNKQYYMSNGSLLLVENASAFSPISQLHYEYYTDEKTVREQLQHDQTIQCIVGKNDIHFGDAQCPGVSDFADAVDTMEFLMKL